VESAASTCDFQVGTKSQHLLTTCIETFRYEALQKDAKDILAADNQNREAREAIAFILADRFSSTLSRILLKRWATYFGLPVPFLHPSFSDPEGLPEKG